VGAELGQIETETVGDVFVVNLIGEFDISNADELQGDLERIAGLDRGLVVSLMRTEFLDSHGVRALYRAKETLRGHHRQLVLHVNTASIVRRVLEISGLATEVPCTGVLEDAVSIAARVGVGQ
jgi:anti-anti-sigma factor